MAEEQPNETTRYPRFLVSVGRFFREHPAIAGSLLYLQVTTIGVVYSWALFRRFDINIFDYAETNDFLLAAFKDPAVFGLSIAFIVLNSLQLAINSVLLQRMHELRLERSADLARRGRITTYILWTTVVVAVPLILFLPFILPFVFANNTAASMLSPTDEPLTSVQYRATSDSKEQTTETGLRVIGTTESFVFFYDRMDTRTLVIPTAQIVEMTHEGPNGEPKEN